MKYKKLNGVKTYCPESGKDLVEYAMHNQKILVGGERFKNTAGHGRLTQNYQQEFRGSRWIARDGIKTKRN